MTFARMLLNKGKLGSVRIISRPSVEMMTRDYLTEEAPQTFFVRKEYFLDAGFGYGLQVQNRQTGYGPNPGAYWWHGATGVAWGTDPKEQLIYVRLIQRMGVYGPFVGDFMTALYAAIDD